MFLKLSSFLEFCVFLAQFQNVAHFESYYFLPPTQWKPSSQLPHLWRAYLRPQDAIFLFNHADSKSKAVQIGPHEKCALISRFHFQLNFDFSPNFYTLYKISFIFRINSKLPTVFSLKSKMRNNSEASTITVTFITN